MDAGLASQKELLEKLRVERRRRWKREYRLRNPRVAERERALKESYRGSCEVCGKLTTGCFGPGKAPKRCTRHAAILSGAARRGKGPRQQQVIRFLVEGSAYFMEIRDATGMSNNQLGILLHRLRRDGHIRRISRGLYELA